MESTSGNVVHRRRWYQYSLRTMLFVVFVLCGLLSWLRLEMNRAQDRRAAIHALGLDEGGMYYAHQHEGHTPLEPPPGPAWLRALLGDDLFQRVDWVLLNSQSLTQEQWRQLEKLSTTRILYFTFAPIKDDDLVHFRDFQALEEMHLMGARITDAGLRHFRGLAKLRYLDIWNTRITEDGLRELRAALPNCKIDFGPPPRPQLPDDLNESVIPESQSSDRSI